jgi:serine/threonine protein kinase
MKQLALPGGPELPAPFGRYQLLQLLGRGNMGAVYLAHDPQLDRSVALKVPHLSPEDSSQILARFYREARAAAALHHPNICPVHEVGEIDGVPYLTMAYIQGKSLHQLTKGKRPMSQPSSAALVRKLAQALEEAHQHGVIHRDLKPTNILIDKRGEPIIMDFGLARCIRPGDERLTQEGTVLGTPAYMPPEQVSGDVEAMGPASDIYTLGVILYELLASRLPFQGDPMSLYPKILLEEPPPPSQFRPDLDPQLEATCLKALAKSPQDRHASMGQFAAALHDYLKRAPRKSGILEPVPSPPAAAGAVPSEKSQKGDVDAQKLAPTTPHTVRTESSARGHSRWKAVGWAFAFGGLAGVLLWLGLYFFRFRAEPQPDTAKQKAPAGPHTEEPTPKERPSTAPGPG